MARKVNTKNLNKLFTGSVISVALLAIVYFIFLWTREDFIMQSYSAGIEWCPSGMESCYAIWSKYLADYRNAQVWSGLLGFVMPAIFYIGKVLVNYIYPETKAQK